jgi:hypothetical protein
MQMEWGYNQPTDIWIYLGVSENGTANQEPQTIFSRTWWKKPWFSEVFLNFQSVI